MNRRLDESRVELQRLSVDILARLNERAKRTLEVAVKKQRLALPIRDAMREAQLLDHLSAHNSGPFDDATVRALFREILDASLALMEGSTARGLRIGSPTIDE